ncbi:kelch-like protein 6 isoform X2 [Hyperolius riggenbachi]
MFTSCMVESQQGEVSLLDVSASTIETILHFIYTGEAAVTLDNVEDLFTVSSRLQITAMQEQCSRFLIKRLNNDNCFWTYRLASTYHHSRLLEMAMKYISWHITSLTKNVDFLNLEQGEIIKILSSDQLMVSSELSVYHMALSWWKANSSRDSPLPVELRRVIRLQLMLPHEREEVENGGSWEECDLQELMCFRLRQGMFEKWIACMDLQPIEDGNGDGDDDNDDFSMHAYDPATDSWNRLKPLKSVSHAECVGLGNYLYVTGGRLLDGSISRAFHVYDSVTNDWTELPSMMSARDEHGFLSFKEKLYAVGGWNEDGILDSMECFDLSKHCWSELSKLPYPLHNFASAQLKGKLYIIGGETTREHHIKRLLIYDIASDMWSLIPNKMNVRYGGAVTMDNKVFVIGGCDYLSGKPTSVTSICFVLDEKGQVCEDLEVPPLAEEAACAGVTRWGERIYVLSKGDEVFYDSIDYWTPGDSDWTTCAQELPLPPDGPSGFGCATLQVPLRKLSHLIPGRFLIKRLNDDNCFWTYRLASTHHHSRLLEMAMKYISWHITSLSDNEDLLHLELGEIIKILSSDQLMVSSELSVYHMALSWWKANSSGDSPLPVELRRVIRLQLMLPHEREEVEKGGRWEKCDLQKFQLRQGMFENWIVCMDLPPRADMDYAIYLDAYDPASNEWNYLKPLEPVMHPRCVASGNNLYVTGGISEDGSVSKAFHVYDSVTDDWTELPSMTTPRSSHGFLSFQEKLYAVGGWNGDGILDLMECFDLSKHCWSELSKLPYLLHSFASAQLKGKLYIIGGDNALEYSIKGLLIYDTASDAWSLIPSKINVRYGGAVTMDNKVFVIGGYDYSSGNPNSATRRCFVLDEKGQVCEKPKVPHLPVKFASDRVAQWGERIYVFGGNSNRSKNIYYWSPGASRWNRCTQSQPYGEFSEFVSAPLQVPLRKLSHLIPGRSSFD